MTTKLENGEHFPASAYAWVGDVADPSTWSLRLWDTLDTKITAAQVARCIAALGATFAGAGLEIPAGMIPVVKSRLFSAWIETHPNSPQAAAPSMLHALEAQEIQKFGMAERPGLMKSASGQYSVQAFKIFKVGGFKDSLGRFSKWTAEDLSQTVQNFHALKESGVFSSVPVRSDHTSSIDKVVAYIDNLYSDGEFLYADFTFTQEQAVGMYSNGTYRNPSIEIGPYETNSGESYYPVCQGFAFVDIPAVEGLFGKNTSSQIFNIYSLQESQVTTFRINGVDTVDAVVVQKHIDTFEAAKPTVHAFRVSGVEVTDVAEVQKTLDTFEAFKADTIKAGREAFVDGLVSAKKLAAPSAEGIKAFATGLSVEQFDAYKATFDGAPVLPLFEKHVGAGDGAIGNTGGDADPILDRIEILEGVVKMSRQAGMDESTLAKQPSMVELTALKASRSR